MKTDGKISFPTPQTHIQQRKTERSLPALCPRLNPLCPHSPCHATRLLLVPADMLCQVEHSAASPLPHLSGDPAADPPLNQGLSLISLVCKMDSIMVSTLQDGSEKSMRGHIPGRLLRPSVVILFITISIVTHLPGEKPTSLFHTGNKSSKLTALCCKVFAP